MYWVRICSLHCKQWLLCYVEGRVLGHQPCESIVRKNSHAQRRVNRRRSRALPVSPTLVRPCRRLRDRYLTLV
jgi:hypothetical protein